MEILLITAIILGLASLIAASVSAIYARKASNIAKNDSIEGVLEKIEATREELKRGITDGLGLQQQAINNAVQASAQSLAQSVSNQLNLTRDAQASSLATLTNLLSSNINSLQQQVMQFTQMAEGKIEAMRNDLKSSLEAMRAELGKSQETMRAELGNNLGQARQDNAMQLEKMRETVDEKLTATLNDRITKSFSLVTESLDSVSKSLGEMKSLSDGVTGLNKVLNNIKTRGNWGELALENLLEQILSTERYKKQFRLKGESEAVDFVIVLPGDENNPVYLPIDCKFPMADYERLIDASERGDKVGVEKASKELVARVRLEAKSVSVKYIKPPETTDFAIIYLPNEGLFAEIVKREGLCDELQNKYRIIVCGPTTVTALLNSLQLGFKTLAIRNRGEEIQKLLINFRNDFTAFAGLLEKTQKQVDKAGETMRSMSNRTKKIQSRLSKIESFGGLEAESELEQEEVYINTFSSDELDGETSEEIADDEK